MFQGHKVAAVVAIGKNRELGKDNKLLWHIPDDLKRFKELTKGHPIILGRKTFESIVGYLGKPLPGRTNIVITRDPHWTRDDVIVARTFESALEAAVVSPGSDIIHIGGGAQLYEQALPFIDTLHLTLVDAESDADSFFPPYEEYFKKVKEEKKEYDGLIYRWVDLERR